MEARMPTPARNPRKLFVNISVKDLERSKAFFARLGFEFNAQFTDEKAACMVVSDEAFFMLLTEPFFRSFTRRDIADPLLVIEGLFCVSCQSRAEVDQLVKIAVENGGSPSMPPMDHGFMYGWSFCDPDGHHWEVMWMDPARVK
jgi:predicted lactoylglutathione lyase